MARILIHAVSAKSGGARTYLLNLVPELAVRGTDEYLVYAPELKLKVTRGQAGRIRVVPTDDSAWWKRLFWDQVTLRRILRRERIDVLFSSSDFGVLWPPCRQVLFLRNTTFFSPNFRQYILRHRSWRDRFDWCCRRLLVKMSARSSDTVMVASATMLEDVKKAVKLTGRTVVNPFGAPKGRFVPRPKPKTAHERLSILYVSEYADYKNITVLLRGVLELVEAGRTGFEVVITMDPAQFGTVESISLDADRKLASDPRLQNIVRFVGAVPYESIVELYAEADIFIFPSFVESFGHPLLEAMISGVPVLAADIPVFRELCGDSAAFFDPFDPGDCARRLAELCDNAALREKLARCGRERAQTRFDWDAHVRRLFEILRETAAVAAAR